MLLVSKSELVEQVFRLERSVSQSCKEKIAGSIMTCLLSKFHLFVLEATGELRKVQHEPKSFVFTWLLSSISLSPHIFSSSSYPKEKWKPKLLLLSLKISDTLILKRKICKENQQVSKGCTWEKVSFDMTFMPNCTKSKINKSLKWDNCTKIKDK